MAMHNPPHPGEFIKETYLDPFHLSVNYLAKKLHVAPSTLHRLVNGQSAVSSKMAYRLSDVLGRSPESWLIMQTHYDLWETKHVKKLKPIDFSNLEDAA